MRYRYRIEIVLIQYRGSISYQILLRYRYNSCDTDILSIIFDYRICLGHIFGSPTAYKVRVIFYVQLSDFAVCEQPDILLIIGQHFWLTYCSQGKSKFLHPTISLCCKLGRLAFFAIRFGYKMNNRLLFNLRIQIVLQLFVIPYL